MSEASPPSNRFATMREAKMTEVEERLTRLEGKLDARKANRKPLVFLGLSLKEEEAKELFDADFRPPIKRGDLSTAIDEGYRWIGIVDGVFHQQYTVSLVEIQQALRRGASLYGSSSMGALRAAEAYTLGMIGVGQIYDWYRSEFIDSDDEVAIGFDEVQGRPLSEPLVNIRATLDAAEAKRIIDTAVKGKLLEAAIAMHYPQRTYRTLLDAIALSTEQRAVLENFFATEAVDLKKLDAVALLKRMQSDYERNRVQSVHP